MLAIDILTGRSYRVRRRDTAVRQVRGVNRSADQAAWRRPASRSSLLPGALRASLHWTALSDNLAVGRDAIAPARLYQDGPGR